MVIGGINFGRSVLIPANFLFNLLQQFLFKKKMSEQEIQQLSDDEDVAIYIDELKADDPNLKLNAVTKIMNIAKILGASRTRDELIPYLTEIIEECDNDDEFLIKLAENLV